MKDSKYLFEGKTMRQARLDAGYRQEDVAENLGITIRQYHRWENDEVTLKPYQVKALDKMFSKPINA